MDIGKCAVNNLWDGNQERDFTYVDDIAEGTIKALKPLGYEIINLGNNQSYKFSEMIHLIEKYTNKEAKYQYEDFHKADMKLTRADISKAKYLLAWQPQISLEEGIKKTVRWTKDNWDWVKNIKV
jgi:UDP-glucuronate 4-epimerase